MTTRPTREAFEPVPEHCSAPTDRVMNDLAARLGIDPQVAERRALAAKMTEFAVQGPPLLTWLDRVGSDQVESDILCRQKFAEALDLIQQAIQELRVVQL